MKNRLLQTLLTILFSATCFSQFSKTHYIPPVAESQSVPVQQQFLYISTPSTTPVTFIINQIGSTSISGTVTRDNPFVYDISSGTNFNQFVVEQSSISQVLNNRGYVVEASDMIYVSIRVIDQSGNQSSEAVSKGLAALGTQFRIGGFTNLLTSNYSDKNLTFASILATENNTTVSFSNIKTGAVLTNNTTVGNTPSSVTLNSGESYIIAVQGPTSANKDALIGTLVSSDKPIAVNCGSFGGTNATGNFDLGFDEIVSAERTGSEYIFVKSTGADSVERVLLIANQDNTEIYLNGNTSTTPDYTLINAGNYINLQGSDFSSNGTMYVRTNGTPSVPKTLFAYQCVGDDGRPDQANQEMFFVPPLSCQTPKVIDNIPFIDSIGSGSSIVDFPGRVTITTKTGAALTFIINSISYTLATLPSSILVTGPIAVAGNSAYECYIMKGFSGNVSVFSTSEVYLAAYGVNGAATFGGYYSGFTFKPEISFQPIVLTQSNCIPNVQLSVNSLTGFDTFQWFFNGVAIPVFSSNYTPNATYGPGYYKVKTTLTACNIDLESDEIPVSNCPTDIDNDGINDNIDLDTDNDGIANCTESYGDQTINISNLISGAIAVGTFSNSFTGVVTTSTVASPIPITGNADGSFVSRVPAGKHNFVEYKMTFTQPISVGIEYVTATANASDLLNSNAQYVISSNTNKTITVLNPSNQLLIDTNYDGIYESGITQYSSFEIRFRVNSTTPIAGGTGTFRFLTNLCNSISFKHENLSDSLENKSTLKFYATCVPIDTDGDGIPNHIDLDSDNDGIPDNIEAQGATFIPILNVDVNHDGIDDAYGTTGITPVDSDTDSVLDYLDLDSDNDGIYDLNESGSGAVDANLNGVLDGTAFGSNGLSDSVETSPDSGFPNYTIANTDWDALNNYIDIDSDGDGCKDVTEAGYTLYDSGTGTLGIGIPTVNANGIVTSGPVYMAPNQDYINGAPISISVHPQDVVTCENQSATFTITSNTVTSYQWLVFNGTTWANVVNNTLYSGATTNTLVISSVSPAMSGYQYKVILLKTGNKCGMISMPATLTTYALPVVTTPITLKQCDDNYDGISVFNLTVNNPLLSSNYTTETFTYFTTFAGADTNDQTVKIFNPIAYPNLIPFSDVVYVRVENANHCYSVAQINLIVSVTQINAATFHKYFTVCDDSVTGVSSDTDGTSIFDFSSVTNAINLQLPLASSNYTISYYASNADALAQINPITNISSYRNTTLNQMLIYVRVDSNNYQGCFGLGPFITLTVEALPVANPVNSTNIIRHCDDDQDGNYNFNTSSLEATILNGQTNKNVTYYDAAGALISITPTFTVNTSQTITVRVTNNVTQASDGPCFDEETLQFIVDKLPQVFSTPAFVSSLVQCDDEVNPALQNGLFPFDTTNYESILLGSQSGMNIQFTLQNGTVLNHLPPTFNTATQNVLVTITNPLNTSCTATKTLNFVVNPTPIIDLNPNGWANELVCTNLPSFTVTINAGVPINIPTSNYSYQWYLNNSIIPGATNYFIPVSISGTYSVVVSTALGCSRTRIIQVNSSVIATIDHINIVDLTDIDTVEVLVTGNSNGNYVYSIDDSYGPYQTSNFFENVTMGIHTVYIKDLNGCGIAEQTISVLGVPRYFTPNDDGYNDTWNIKGVNDKFYSDSIIKIYDRYGKFIKQIAALGAGWDGTYNGQLVPADDYWYSINFDDGRSAKGHFSLKR
jgi:gliding motility-associated-like protein